MLRLLKRLITGRPERSKARDDLLGMMLKRAVCAEIGVWRGDFSQRILDVTLPRELHLVDPWAYMPNLPLRGYGGRVAKSQAGMDDMAEAVAARFRHDAPRCLPSAALHRVPEADPGQV